MSTEVNERFNAEILKTLEERRQCRPSDTAALLGEIEARIGALEYRQVSDTATLLLALDARLRVIEGRLAAIARAFDSNSGNLT